MKSKKFIFFFTILIILLYTNYHIAISPNRIEWAFTNRVNTLFSSDTTDITIGAKFYLMTNNKYLVTSIRIGANMILKVFDVDNDNVQVGSDYDLGPVQKVLINSVDNINFSMVEDNRFIYYTIGAPPEETLRANYIVFDLVAKQFFPSSAYNGNPIYLQNDLLPGSTPGIQCHILNQHYNGFSNRVMMISYCHVAAPATDLLIINPILTNDADITNNSGKVYTDVKYVYPQTQLSDVSGKHSGNQNIVVLANSNKVMYLHQNHIDTGYLFYFYILDTITQNESNHFLLDGLNPPIINADVETLAWDYDPFKKVGCVLYVDKSNFFLDATFSFPVPAGANRDEFTEDITNPIIHAQGHANSLAYSTDFYIHIIWPYFYFHINLDKTPVAFLGGAANASYNFVETTNGSYTIPERSSTLTSRSSIFKSRMNSLYFFPLKTGGVTTYYNFYGSDGSNPTYNAIHVEKMSASDECMFKVKHGEAWEPKKTCHAYLYEAFARDIVGTDVIKCPVDNKYMYRDTCVTACPDDPNNFNTQNNRCNEQDGYDYYNPHRRYSKEYFARRTKVCNVELGEVQHGLECVKCKDFGMKVFENQCNDNCPPSRYIYTTEYDICFYCYNKFVEDNQCVEKCSYGKAPDNLYHCQFCGNVGLYDFLGECLADCPHEDFVKVNFTCECPSDKPLIENNRCVTKCQDGHKQNEYGECSLCGENEKYVHLTNQCVSSCPFGYLPDDNNLVCYKCSDSSLFFITNTSECTSYCLESEYVIDYDLKHCTYCGKIIFNLECLDICPEGYGKHIGSDNIPSCKSCATTTLIFWDNGECISSCPSDRPLIPGTRSCTPPPEEENNTNNETNTDNEMNTDNNDNNNTMQMVELKNTNSTSIFQVEDPGINRDNVLIPKVDVFTTDKKLIDDIVIDYINEVNDKNASFVDTTILIDSKDFTVQLSHGINNETDKLAIENGLAIVNFTNCQNHLRDIKEIGQREKLLISVTNYKESTTIKDESKVNVEFDLYSEQGREIDKKLCDEQEVTYKIKLDKDDEDKFNKTLFDQLKIDPGVDILDPKSPFFNDLCVSYIKNETQRDITINTRRADVFQNQTVQCNGILEEEPIIYFNDTVKNQKANCSYDSIDENDYVTCDCTSTDIDGDIGYKFKKSILESITSTNFDLIKCTKAVFLLGKPFTNIGVIVMLCLFVMTVVFCSTYIFIFAKRFVQKNLKSLFKYDGGEFEDLVEKEPNEIGNPKDIIENIENNIDNHIENIKNNKIKKIKFLSKENQEIKTINIQPLNVGNPIEPKDSNLNNKSQNSSDDSISDNMKPKVKVGSDKKIEFNISPSKKTSNNKDNNKMEDVIATNSRVIKNFASNQSIAKPTHNNHYIKDIINEENNSIVLDNSNLDSDLNTTKFKATKQYKFESTDYEAPEGNTNSPVRRRSKISEYNTEHNSDKLLLNKVNNNNNKLAVDNNYMDNDGGRRQSILSKNSNRHIHIHASNNKLGYTTNNNIINNYDSPNKNSHKNNNSTDMLNSNNNNSNKDQKLNHNEIELKNLNDTKKENPMVTSNRLLVDKDANKDLKKEEPISDTQKKVNELLSDKRTNKSYFSDSLRDHHAIIGLVYKRSIINPFPVRFTNLMFGFSCMFLSNALFFTSGYVKNREKLGAGEDGFQYIVLHEFAKSVWSVLLVMGISMISALIVKAPAGWVSPLKASIKSHNEENIKMELKAFYKKMRWRYILYGVFVFCVNAFNFVFVTCFCVIYKTTVVGWLIGAMISLVLKFFFIQVVTPVLLTIFRHCAKKHPKNKCATRSFFVVNYICIKFTICFKFLNRI